MDTIIRVFIDGEGRKLEVIQMIRNGYGFAPWIRVSWHNNFLLGDGYYRRLDDALALVDIDTLVELVTLPTARPS